MTPSSLKFSLSDKLAWQNLAIRYLAPHYSHPPTLPPQPWIRKPLQQRLLSVFGEIIYKPTPYLI